MVRAAIGDTQNAPRYVVPANALSNYQFTVFTSVLAITSSNLLDPEPTSMFRQIRGYMHTQEWERFCSFFCMVFGEEELHAQIYENTISVTTRAKAKESGVSSSTSERTTADCKLGMAKRSFSNIMAGGSSSKSPVKVTGSPSKSSSVKSAINFEETGMCSSFCSQLKLMHAP
jgi:hypothetical protein